MPFYTIDNNNISNFLEDIYTNNNCIFFYHWNSCHHCHTFKPVFYNVLRNLINNDKELMDDIYVFQVEYGDFDLLPNKLKDVQAFPSVIAYSNGSKVDEFKQQRNENNLSNFILSSFNNSKSPSKSLSKSSLLANLSTGSKKNTKKIIKKYS